MDDHLFIIVQAIQTPQYGNEIEMHALNLFLGKDYLVTSFLCEQMPPVEAIRKRLLNNSQPTPSPDVMCHAILDRLVDDYMPTLEWIVDEIESIEDNLLTDPGKQTLEKVLDLIHTIIHFRHVNHPHRDIMTT